MRVADIFKQKTVLSIEVFPPKPPKEVESIFTVLDELQKYEPDFISVTSGTGGFANNSTTIEIASEIKKRYGIEGIAHLPGVALTRDDVSDLLKQMKDSGVKNILALRGDSIPDVPPAGHFNYAVDLVNYIKDNGDSNVLAACYPECHTESPSFDIDIDYLKEKVDAGSTSLMTQLFFDNGYFYNFMEKIRAKGINVPVEAGIMPVTSRRQIDRMLPLCGSKLPPRFAKIVDCFEHDPLALREAGIAFAIDQIVDLLANGVDGIHLYTMNNEYVTSKICEAIKPLIDATKK